MKKKILTLAAVVTLPFILLVMYLLASMASYSNTYSEIVSNMTVANNYNLNFKEEMDESLYKLVVGYVTLDNIESDKSRKKEWMILWTASMPEAGTVRISRCWITISIFLQS